MRGVERTWSQTLLDLATAAAAAAADDTGADSEDHSKDLDLANGMKDRTSDPLPASSGPARIMRAAQQALGQPNTTLGSGPNPGAAAGAAAAAEKDGGPCVLLPSKRKRVASAKHREGDFSENDTGEGSPGGEYGKGQTAGGAAGTEDELDEDKTEEDSEGEGAGNGGGGPAGGGGRGGRGRGGRGGGRGSRGRRKQPGPAVGGGRGQGQQALGSPAKLLQQLLQSQQQQLQQLQRPRRVAQAPLFMRSGVASEDEEEGEGGRGGDGWLTSAQANAQMVSVFCRQEAV